MAKGKVYIIQHFDSYYYKMGLTKDTIYKRIKELQTGNPYPLRPRLYHNVVDMRLAEDILHKKYAAYRGLGEWFYFNPKNKQNSQSIEEVITYIENELDAEIEFRLLLKELSY
jgi:hypothetical protein